VSTLYVLHRSPYSAPEMETALRLAMPEDGIILTQDAVLALRSAPKEIDMQEALNKNLKLYALKVDMDARSVKTIPGVEMIDYDEFIELLFQYESILS
jgi:tRNA 2-thiouridine synthesizing protein B